MTMYFKIAFRNIKKRYKDYSIYFITLILAVAVFYSFNSIDSQKALFDIKSSNTEYMDKLMWFMDTISIIVSFVFGFLMLYSNNFLIKKRKKEFGTMMLLGMGRKNVSKILVTETFIAGIISLLSGIIIGIFLSQALSLFTIKLFDINLNEYAFSFSYLALIKTCMYFAIIFFIIMLFNVFIISKYKIIDLIKGSRKNEKMIFHNSKVYIFISALSLALLISSYIILLKIGIDYSRFIFKAALFLLVCGIFMFFFSLKGIIIYLSHNKSIYFKNINIFIVKEAASKSNTNFISMSVISIMLLITILILSSGISVKRNYEQEFKMITPFDASVIFYPDKGNETSLDNALSEINFEKSDEEKTSVINSIFNPDITLDNMYGLPSEVFKDTAPEFIKLSEYNDMLSLKNENKIDLKDDEILILSNYREIVDKINNINKDSVNINGKQYKVKNKNVIEDNLETFIIAANYCSVVINDDFMPEGRIFKSVLNVMYKNENREELNKKYDYILYNNMSYRKNGINIDGSCKDTIYTHEKNSSTSILFAAIYIGIVFLITSMAVLSLQELSEAGDSIEKYKSLKRIGADTKMINGAIFSKIFIHFSFPALLAVINSIIGIIIISKEINSYSSMDMKFSALSTGLIFIIMYVVYFYATYTGYKNIVNRSVRDYN